MSGQLLLKNVIHQYWYILSVIKGGWTLCTDSMLVHNSFIPFLHYIRKMVQQTQIGWRSFLTGHTCISLYTFRKSTFALYNNSGFCQTTTWVVCIPFFIHE